MENYRSDRLLPWPFLTPWGSKIGYFENICKIAKKLLKMSENASKMIQKWFQIDQVV